MVSRQRFGTLARRSNEFDPIDLVFSKVHGVSKSRLNNRKLAQRSEMVRLQAFDQENIKERDRFREELHF